MTSAFGTDPEDTLSFDEKFPGVVHNHAPRVCEEGVGAYFCSEVYQHKSDKEMRDWYVKKAWIESVMQCGTQRDILHSDDRHPIGHQVFTFLECNEDEFMRATPTTGPARSAE